MKMNIRSLFAYLIFVAFSSLSDGQCSIQSLSPSCGPISGGTNITVSIQGNQSGSHLFLSSTTLSAVSSTESLTFETPASDSPGPVFVTFQGCNGSLPFQYYKNIISSVTLDITSQSEISLAGGQYFCAYFDDGLFVQDFSMASIRFSCVNGMKVDYTMLEPLLGSNQTKRGRCARSNSLLNSTFFGLCNFLDVSFSLNSQYYETVITNVRVGRLSAFRAAFLYIGSVSDLSWNYAHNIGVLDSTSLFPISLIADIYQSVNFNSLSSIEATLSLDQYHMVFIDSTINADVAKALSIHYPSTQFFICGALPNLNIASNVKYFWAEQYQTFYLTGIAAALMMSPGETLCFMRAFDNSEFLLNLNAFAHGFSKYNPRGRILEMYINSYDDAYTTVRGASNFLSSGKCKIFALNIDNPHGLKIFTDNGQMAIGSYYDARKSYGNLIITSSLLNWKPLYLRMLQQYFDGTSDNSFLLNGFNDGAVYLADLSLMMPPEVHAIINSEINTMNTLGADNVVLCGPARDSFGHLRYASGYCPSVVERYSIDWVYQNITSLGLFVPDPPSHSDNSIPNSGIYAAITLMSLLYVFVLFCILWTYKYREHPLIKFAQPKYLYCICVGCFVGLSTIIPLTYQLRVSDAEAFLGSQAIITMNNVAVDRACQSLPWLLVVGYSFIFPSLFGKTFYLHRSIASANVSKKTSGQTMAHILAVSGVGIYLVLLLVPLAIWQAEAPLTWQIHVTKEDSYGNPIASYGSCYSNLASAPYAIVIGVLIMLAMITGLYICFVCRHDETVNNEIFYITLSQGNFFQITLITVPLIVLNERYPSYKFAFSCVAIFLSFGGSLFFVYIPKMMTVHTLEPKAGTISISASFRISNDVIKDRSFELQHSPSSNETSNPMSISAQGESDYTNAQEVINSALAETVMYDKS